MLSNKFPDDEFESQINNYMRKGLLNTIFYGPCGSGKNTLVTRMLNSTGEKSLKDIDDCEKEIHGYWNNEDISFYTTSKYIKFEGKQCIDKVSKLVRIIEEISETKNIDKNFKIIYIKNFNLLNEKQEILRQVVEDTFETCRFIFTVRNIDKVDKALFSRCMSIRIPCPSLDYFNLFIEEQLPNLTKKQKDELIDSSFRNLNTLKISILYFKDFKTICNANKNIADSILSDLSKSDTITDIHNLAEKYFTSEINILDVCRYLNLNSEILDCLIEYSNLNSPSLYKLTIIFYKIKLSML